MSGFLLILFTFMVIYFVSHLWWPSTTSLQSFSTLTVVTPNKPMDSYHEIWYSGSFINKDRNKYVCKNFIISLPFQWDDGRLLINRGCSNDRTPDTWGFVKRGLKVPNISPSTNWIYFLVATRKEAQPQKRRSRRRILFWSNLVPNIKLTFQLKYNMCSDCCIIGGCDGKRKPTLCEWKGGRCNCIDGAVVQPQFACLEQAQVQARLYYPSEYIEWLIYVFCKEDRRCNYHYVTISRGCPLSKCVSWINRSWI